MIGKPNFCNIYCSCNSEVLDFLLNTEISIGDSGLWFKKATIKIYVGVFFLYNVKKCCIVNVEFLIILKLQKKGWFVPKTLSIEEML